MLCFFLNILLATTSKLFLDIFLDILLATP